MQIEKKNVTGEQLKDTVRCYCLIENRWLTDEETLPLRICIGEAWSGMFVDAVKAVFGSKSRTPRYGQYLNVIPLPFPRNIEQYPEVSKEMAGRYGYALAFSGEGVLGIELYFVERSAISLSAALAKFESLIQLKSS